ncbi:sensor domain-containing protein [Streptomyces scabiei]|uniref:sensor histidine kinase n=1 Tax=Streptomyces scabiei TaxID=1930 RepID=UPI001B31300F|nr:MULTISPECIES: sensor histidine kinase [Streptomyces]MBP5876007.1 sensor histidine kinase [Streptomyces sp. LBUM 1477]MBP5883734.1 sensor histidine kinase [Streptomyces sp. LBUM 1487]MDW8473249.1 sensor domain-containing protein [Streptomyces scabiei]MDX2572296.1 sensor domain-containing protein [Streptomyces scabiei]MDX2630016.1 sensor domain-containing protein [Streptomyces scabiei]
MIRTVLREVPRAVAYLLSGVLVGAPLLVVLLVLGVLGLALAPVLVGLPLLAVAVVSGIPVGALERRRLALTRIPSPPGPHATPAEPGLAAWTRLRLTERATWRELAYTLLLGLVLWPFDAAVLLAALGVPGALIGAPLHLAANGGAGGDARIVKLWLIDSYGQALLCTAAGAALLLALLWPLVRYARLRAALARLLLAPSEAEAERRLGEVTRSRARLVAAFEAERRRIERDLHDGAQQRLVSLSMTLGLARLDAPPELAARLAAAHQEADQVLGELRELIHGIHPQVLADYGLPDALADAADRSVVPVELDVDLPRFAEPVESAAYFAVREALANIGRHSGAERARIGGRYAGGVLRVEVWDDGTGGADPAHGTGLTGLADRLAVLDGRLSVHSPAGGPTVLSLEIPCPQR